MINEGWVAMRQAPLTADIFEAEVRLLAREMWVPEFHTWCELQIRDLTRRSRMMTVRVLEDVLVTDDTDDVLSQASARLVHVDGELEPSEIEREGEGGEAMELPAEPTTQQMLDYLLAAKGEDWLKRYCRQHALSISGAVVEPTQDEEPFTEQRADRDVEVVDDETPALGEGDEDEETSSSDDLAPSDSTSQVSSWQTLGVLSVVELECVGVDVQAFIEHPEGDRRLHYVEAWDSPFCKLRFREDDACRASRQASAERPGADSSAIADGHGPESGRRRRAAGPAASSCELTRGTSWCRVFGYFFHRRSGEGGGALEEGAGTARSSADG